MAEFDSEYSAFLERLEVLHIPLAQEMIIAQQTLGNTSPFPDSEFLVLIKIPGEFEGMFGHVAHNHGSLCGVMGVTIPTTTLRGSQYQELPYNDPRLLPIHPDVLTLTDRQALLSRQPGLAPFLLAPVAQ